MAAASTDRHRLPSAQSDGSGECPSSRPRCSGPSSASVIRSDAGSVRQPARAVSQLDQEQHCLVGNLMSQVRQRTVDAIVSPTRGLLCAANDPRFHLASDARTARVATRRWPTEEDGLGASLCPGCLRRKAEKRFSSGAGNWSHGSSTARSLSKANRNCKYRPRPSNPRPPV